MEAMLSFGPTITKNYRVPAELRAVKHNAYTPWMFLIGPLHRDKLELKYMEKEKRRYMSHFFDRLEEQGNYKQTFVNNAESSVKSDQTLARDKCHKLLIELENEAREWYAEDIDLDKRQLVERLLLDGCFKLELFYK
ncbi:hypothetical protein DCAR_0415336 [Daucus carota subsp. sativus]|uniref:Uncharacterized protein n=1 Tax=Daucus carota subsp. sativus TaxID=79200 RepID=A0A162A787_DAUCS|nr:hypothetical protein DCAR_0415336 [Daucus carota subsp. sativus]